MTPTLAPPSTVEKTRAMLREAARRPEAAEREAQRIEARHCGLYEFNRNILGHTLANETLHRPLCSWFEERDRRDTLMLLPRGHLKSSLITMGAAIWEAVHDPNKRILIVSSTPTLSTALVRAIKGHFETNERLRAAFPDSIWKDPRKESPKWTESELTLRRTASKKEATITGMSAGQAAVGSHYDRVYYDDIVNDDWVTTSDMIHKLEDWFALSLSLPDPGAPHAMLGTRYHDADLYGALIARGHFAPDCITVRQLEEGGAAIFPEVFTPEHIERLRRQVPAYQFSCQYLNDPINPEDAVFRREWFRYYRDAPQGLRWFVTVDSAFGKQRDNDEAVVLAHGVGSDGTRYFEDLEHGRWGPDGLIERALRMAERFEALSIGLEKGAAIVIKNEMQKEMRKRGWEFVIFDLDHGSDSASTVGTGPKRRIEALQPLYSNGTILHSERLRGGELEGQLLRYPRGRHDDCADAAAYSLQQGREAAFEMASLDVHALQVDPVLRRRGQGWELVMPLIGDMEDVRAGRLMRACWHSRRGEFSALWVHDDENADGEGRCWTVFRAFSERGPLSRMARLLVSLSKDGGKGHEYLVDLAGGDEARGRPGTETFADRLFAEIRGFDDKARAPEFWDGTSVDGMAGLDRIDSMLLGTLARFPEHEFWRGRGTESKLYETGDMIVVRPDAVLRQLTEARYKVLRGGGATEEIEAGGYVMALRMLAMGAG